MQILTDLARRLRRWDLAIQLVAFVLPIAGLAILGAWGLVRSGGWLTFLLVTLAVNLLAWGVRRTARRPARPGDTDGDAAANDPVARPHVDLDPDWGDADRAAFDAARRLVARRLREPVAWAEFQRLAGEVIAEVARAMPGGKGALDFTAPEALLLVERVAARFRGDLRALVPFSDRVRLAHLAWVWRNRARLRQGHDLFEIARHGVRLATHLPAGLVGLLDAALGTRSQSYLTAEGLAALQAVLLEEIARAAVDLYSGRLRFSDAELLQIQAAGAEVDRARRAAPDAPLRVVVVGQVSAGKSSLISALAGEDLTETDLAPTTETETAYPVEIDGQPCHLVDTGGLDGSASCLKALAEQIRAADLVLWVLRADRPARAPDRALLCRIRALFDAEPERRPAPIVPVVTGIDLVVDGWPFPEHRLDAAARARIGDVVQAIADDPGLAEAVPVSLAEPSWNVASVLAALAETFPEALAVQRNRARIAGRPAGLAAAKTDLRRAGRGMVSGAGRLGRAFLHRRGRGDPPGPGGGME